VIQVSSQLVQLCVEALLAVPFAHQTLIIIDAHQGNARFRCQIGHPADACREVLDCSALLGKGHCLVAHVAPGLRTQILRLVFHAKCGSNNRGTFGMQRMNIHVHA
jgi:hypothetical protein